MHCFQNDFGEDLLSESTHACDLNFIVKGERLLKVTCSHVHCKSGNISETVLNECPCSIPIASLFKCVFVAHRVIPLHLQCFLLSCNYQTTLDVC